MKKEKKKLCIHLERPVEPYIHRMCNKIKLKKLATAGLNDSHLPRRCVQMFPVSVWILKIDLKQAANEGSGGLEERTNIFFLNNGHLQEARFLLFSFFE